MDSSLLERKAKLHALIKNAKAAILDFDGLLADSEPYHYKAYNEVFERYGHTLDKDEYWIESWKRIRKTRETVSRYFLKCSQ